MDSDITDGYGSINAFLLQIIMDLDEYITLHSDRQPQHLAQLYRETHLHRLYSRMCCEPAQGRLLKMLTRMIAPKRILELGTFSGYSTLCFAEGMPEGAEVHSVEIDDEAEDSILAAFNKTPWADRIHLHIGDAMEIVPKISHTPWDMVFIDANKRQYSDYYNMIKPLVRPGGYIIADNTLWSGKVLETAAPNDIQTIELQKFNELVANDTEVEKVIIPVRDGLTIIHKLDLTK